MDDKKENGTAARNAANIKLAIGLGLLAFCFYAGFILMNYLD